MLEFSINGRLPGDEISLSEKGKISISAKAFGHPEQVPLSKLEIIAHGKVIKEIIPGIANQTSGNLVLDFDFDVENGIWIAARCFAGPNQIAHTTPVYVTLNDNGFQNEESMDEYLALNEKYLQELEQELIEPNENVNQRAWWYKKGLKQRIEDTRKIINSIKEK